MKKTTQLVKFKKPTKADILLLSDMKAVKRMMIRSFPYMCKELHASCPQCQAHLLIGYLNLWIDNME